VSNQLNLGKGGKMENNKLSRREFMALCPIGHIYMMKGMHTKSCEHHKTEEPKQIEFKHY
jgi:hypothetical protein